MQGDMISKDAVLAILKKNSIYEVITNSEGKNTIQLIEELPSVEDKIVSKLEDKIHKNNTSSISDEFRHARNSELMYAIDVITGKVR